MILFQNTSVTATGQFYHSAKRDVTNSITLCDVSVAPSSWNTTNVPASHEVIYVPATKEFKFQHTSPLTAISLGEGKYSIGLTITVGSTTFTLVFVIYVVKDYRVEEHVFEGQILSGYLNKDSRLMSDCTLSIFVCEKDSSAYYRRFTYTNTLEQPIDAIAVVPQKKVSIDVDSIDGVKHQEYSVDLQPNAPIQHIFERFIALQNQTFVDSEVNEDTLFAYLRLVDSDGDSLCEGIIDTQDGRFQFQYETETIDAVREDETGQATTLEYRASNSITLQIYSPSTLLKAIPVVDNVSEKINYTPFSDGKGFADYLYNEFITDPFTIAQKQNDVKIYDVIERFAKYINRQSVLAKTGIMQSTSESMEAYGYKQFCAITLSLPTIAPPQTVRTLKIDDVIELEILLLNFVLSDTYGDGEQDNGEKRSFNVERTRGLRGTDGKFPRRDSEFDFSFLLLDNAEEILNALTIATAYLPAFEVITESAGAGTHKRYKLRTLLTRPMNRGERKNNISNIIEIDKTSKTINVVDDGEIDIQNQIIRQFDQISAGKLRYSEIDGFGQEYESGINDGFFLRNEIEIRNQNEVRAVGATSLEVNDELIVASRRKTGSQIFITNLFVNNQLSAVVGAFRNAPIFYAVILDDYVRFASYFAEGLLLYQTLRLALLRREIIENIQLNHIADVKRINEATVIKTNLLSDGNTMVYYKLLDADIDLVDKSAVLKLERVKSPFVKYQFNTQMSKVIEVKYDSAVIQWHGIRPRRIDIGFNANNYPSYPNILPFNTSMVADEKKEFTTVDYAIGAGLFGDAYEGANVLWFGFSNPQLTLVRFQNGKREIVKNQLSVANASNLFDELTSQEKFDVYKRNARYVVEVKDDDGKRLAGLDVAKGCLVVRSKPANVDGVGVEIRKFADIAPTFTALLPTGVNVSYTLYAESVFTYRGRFCLFAFVTSGFDLVRIEFHERFIVVSPAISYAKYFVFDESFNVGDEIHFEIYINNSAGVPNFTLQMRLNGVNYSDSDFVTSLPSSLMPVPLINIPASRSAIACVSNEAHYVCMKLFRAFAGIMVPTPKWERLCDLSFNNIGANNADEFGASLAITTPPEQTRFIEFTGSTTTFTNATEYVSIQPEIAFNLPQV